jgi:hypothetical protein
VPGPAVWVVVGVGSLGERAVHAVTIFGHSRPIGGRPNERMGELDAPAHDKQPGVHRGVDSRHVDLEGLGGRVEQDRITERLGGRREHEELRVGRESAEPSREAILDLGGNRMTLR